MAAVTLLTQYGTLEALIGQEGFCNRRQQFNHARGQRLGIAVAKFRHVQLFAHIHSKCATRFNQCFLGEQHAANIGVYNDWVGRAGLVNRASRCTALQTLTRVFTRPLVSGLRSAQPLNTD